ncbi:hypothetical protein LMQOC1_50020 [Listeria monocytogenes QOC1]|nr:hypothetical protein LMQOC1_20003 [Listeria monocytogenes QOC1]CDK43176.1 hypothetical protein LMQOC1_50020 [Listeria monocytogenes QOC1]CUL84060.1 hypothetical protein LM83088_280002 [Listeria monocytogenes]
MLGNDIPNTIIVIIIANTPSLKAFSLFVAIFKSITPLVRIVRLS